MASKHDSKVLKHVMISYQWDCQKRMIKLRDKLKTSDYNVWMDINNMGGDTLACMAEAVENADVVIMCVSKKYQESKCCKKEAEYAFQKDKVIVPLKVEKDFQASGWLGLLMGTALYYRGHDDDILDEVFPDLIKELGEKGRTAQQATWSPIKLGGSKALQCSVCLERFKTPKMLPCLHRFCAECLVRLAPRGAKTISCPICRKQATINKGDVTQFPTDFHLQELVEEEAARHQLTGREVEFSCTCCDVGKQSKVVAKCQDCKHYICSSGLSAHKRFTGLRDHVLLILDETDDANDVSGQVETMALSDKSAQVKSEPKRKVNHWKIFDELYDDEHSIHLLKYWIQKYDGDSQWQEQMVAHYLTCLIALEDSGIASEDALAKRQTQVAKVFKHAGQYAEAITLIEKILDIEIKELGGRTENLADLYYLISDVYSEMLNSVALIRDVKPDDVQKYIKYIRNSLKLRRKLKNQKYNLGYALRSLSNALRNWIDYGGDDNLTVADARTEARKCIDEAIKIFTKLNAKGNLAKCIMNKVSLEAERGSEEKEKSFRKSLALCDETYGECSVLTGQLCWNLFVLFHSKKDFYEAYKWLDRCENVRGKIFGEFHPQTQMLYDWLKRSIYVEIAKRTKDAQIIKDHRTSLLENESKDCQGYCLSSRNVSIVQNF